MNKVLITGLGIGNSMGICQVCNMDYSWLINNPGTFIWADKICVPAELFGHYSNKKSKFVEAINHIMNIADDAGMIEKIEIPESWKKDVEKIYSSAVADAKQIAERFPEVVMKGNDGVPNEIVINGNSFCGPYISSIYASIELANRIGANCLFSEKANNFLSYRYGLDADSHIHRNRHKVYNQIFQTLIPNEQILPEYVIEPDTRCKSCENNSKCKKTYISDIEKQMSSILKWREYDEICQAKEVIDDILWRKNNLKTDREIKEVITEFNAKKKTINENINRRFPAIRRWTNLVAVIASPIAVYSTISGDTTIAAVSAGLVGLSTAVEKITDVYKSKNNWVGFFDKKLP